MRFCSQLRLNIRPLAVCKVKSPFIIPPPSKIEYTHKRFFPLTSCGICILGHRKREYLKSRAAIRSAEGRKENFTFPFFANQIIVIALTTLSLAFNLWGFIQLRQEFDRIWFLPTSSYLYKKFSIEKEYYPEAGEFGAVFFGQLNYTEVRRG